MHRVELSGTRIECPAFDRVRLFAYSMSKLTTRRGGVDASRVNALRISSEKCSRSRYAVHDALLWPFARDSTVRVYVIVSTYGHVQGEKFSHA